VEFDGDVYISAATWLPPILEFADEEIARGRLDPRAAERMGVRALPVSLDLAPPEMAVLAGRRALEQAATDPGDIGMLAHAWVYHQGREKWSPAHYVASELGLPSSALPFGVQELCSGGTSGLICAVLSLRARPGVAATMVTTADRFAAPVWDRWRNHPVIGFGDGATAAVLSRGPRGSRALELVALTYSSASWLEGTERGDTPFTRFPMEGRATLDASASRAEFYAVHGRDCLPRAAREHAAASLKTALEDARLDPADPRIELVTAPRLGPGMIEMMYGELLDDGLRPRYRPLGDRTGHLGAGDMLANLADIAGQRLLRPGQFAVVLGAGGGFTWSTAIVRAVSP
jgi:3-oxoacyl-[acyl-carrier-protein] synthase-3